MKRLCAIFTLLAWVVASAACDLGGSGGASPSVAGGEAARPPEAKPNRTNPTNPTNRTDRTNRTNVLLITLDTTRADALGVYGQNKVVTPHIDALAHDGVVFEDCFSSSPSTLPSHASIFTGRHPYAHGVRANAGYALGESEVTLAETLRSHGYRTRAEIASEVMVGTTRIGQGFASFHGVHADDVDLLKLRVLNGTDERNAVLMARSASDITRHGIRFLETAQAFEDPFFLWLHYFDPHRPLAPPERFRKRLPDDLYLAEVAYADHAIGDVLTALVRLDLADDTLVVITADHGEGLGEHDEVNHAYFLYNTTIRVPLILRGPGVARAKRVKSFVRTVDIAPTILDLLELPPLEATQGISLRSLMSGAESPDLIGYGESIELLKAFGAPVLRFARQGPWKYIHTSPPELYDLASDPAELDNAAEREPERVAELRAALTALLRQATTTDDSVIAIDAETQRRLEALGYLAGPPPELPDELASLTLGPPVEGYSPAADVLLLSHANGEASYHYYSKAIEKYRELRTRHPDSRELLRRLVKSLHGLEDPAGTSSDEVAALLGQAVELDPENGEIFVQLGELAMRTGDAEEAFSALRLASKLDPCSGPPRSMLINLLHAAERHQERFDAAREGVLQCPELASALNDMAWILSTSRVDEQRDGQQAVDLAKRAMATSADGASRPGFRDTLAAAYAESGDFERAASMIAEIITDLQKIEAPSQIVAQFESHLSEFEARRPLRE